MNNKTFSDKVALVTGGTSGIGRTTAIAFARAGAKVVLTGRREKEGAQVVAEIKKLGGDAAFIRAVLAKDVDVKAMVDFTVDKFGRLDIAFNNAGVEWIGPLDQATEAEYRRIFDINVWGVLNSMRHEIPVMLKSGGGAIVNTSSVAGHVGMGQVSIYTASKHAVEGLTKALALEFAKQNIRINAVAPAGVATEMVDRFAGKEGEMRDYLTSLHPVGRNGASKEIAAAVLYLCSDDAKFTTGTSLVVDGGMLAPIKNTFKNRNIMSRTIEVDLLPQAFEEAKEKPRILVIDDNRDFIYSAKLGLERTGRYSVWKENEPVGAHQTAQRVKPDLIRPHSQENCPAREGVNVMRERR